MSFVGRMNLSYMEIDFENDELRDGQETDIGEYCGTYNVA